MRRKSLRHGFPWIFIGILGLSTIGFADKSLSHVRVVRLSYVSGTVGLKRPGSADWAKAQVNTPIQEGFELSTSAQSYAEVEFENGSTARLGESSKISFDRLAMDESGNKVNQLTFAQGYGTFHFLPEHHDAYSVKVAQATLTPNGKSEFRADFDKSKVRVEVFSGTVELATSDRTVKLGKDKVEEFDPGATQLALNPTQGIVKDSWDKWTAGRDTQTQLSLSDQAVAGPGQLYGWGDLNAYGEWGYFPGSGYGWAPYVSAGWSPYTMGMWNFYPGMGYTWISGEPWGWLPYHYGSWGFNAGFGWYWMPGNFDNFSPAMVNWYSGPGWIGWAPLGGVGVVTTIPTHVVQNGLMVSPQIVNHVPVSAGTLIRNMPFEPGAGALRPGPPLGSSAQGSFASPVRITHANAPTSILMGGDAGREQTLQTMRTGHEPLRSRMGTTLGGQFTVSGNPGEFRGDPFHGKSVGGESWHGAGATAGAGGAVMLSHGRQSSFSNQAAFPGAAARPGGGGFGGGYGHGAPNNSAGSVSAPPAHSSSASSSPSVSSHR